MRSRVHIRAAFIWATLAQVFAVSQFGCKLAPHKAAPSATTPPASAECPPAQCLKSGDAVALVGAANAEVRSGSGVNEPLSFSGAGILKGDQVFAFARVMYPKGTSGTKNTLQFQSGSEKAGDSTVQFIGDDAFGSSVARLSTHFVAGSQGAPKISLRTSVSSSVDVQASNGGLLVFRSMSLQDALRAENQDKVHFASDFADFDTLATKSLPVSGAPAKIVSGVLKSTLGQDIFLARAGASWEISSGKLTACDGALITWQLTADDSVIATDGPYSLSAGRPSGYSSVQAIHKGAGKAVSRFDMRAIIKPGSGADKASCTVDVGEPSTLSVVVFRRASDLGAAFGSARFLRELGTTSHKPDRFASNSSSPPIESIAHFSWEHQQDDALLLDVNLVLGAEDRVQQTKVLAQLNRAPDGLSSSVARRQILSPDRPSGFHINDMALDRSDNPLTKFFITAMAVNADAKPVAVLESKIVFMHWRKLATVSRPAGQLSLSSSETPKIPVAKGRQVSLFDIRASMFAGTLPPALDGLPCPYFKQGPRFNMAAIPGGPPVPIPGPIQNYYSGNWNGDTQYIFRVSLWNRLYRDVGIPDWTLEQPVALATQYVPKLFDIIVTNPTKPGCAMTARRLN